MPLLIFGLIIGTVGWLLTLSGHGDLIPPSGGGWLELLGLGIVIPTACYLKIHSKLRE